MFRDFYNEFNLIDYSIGEWSHWTEQGDMSTKRCRKILVPLDRSFEATERVLSVAQEVLVPGGEGILLHVLPPQNGRMSGLRYMPAEEVENMERSRALGFLGYFVNRLNRGECHWRPEVVVASPVAAGIREVAMREDVDLIAMYTHDRRGLAKLIKGSVCEKVKELVPHQVRVVRPMRELAAR